MSNSPFPLRMAQIDLARQMESMDFLRRFITLAARSGYNAVLMYLEGRVRTASTQFFKVEETYSVEEMKELTAFAAAQGIDLIPCVSTLGHANLFLAYPELAHLSETRERGVGRFWGGGDVFCPHIPEVRTFLETYLAEICEIFPSPYFHAGFDETFDLGLCSECSRHNTGDLFVEYLEFTRATLAKLGKRIMIWDDMFEYFPEKLDRVNRDVILVTWCYDEEAGTYRGHFSNSTFFPPLKRYRAMGFETIIAPADYLYDNTVSFTSEAWRTPPVLGGLITTWEKSDAYMAQSLPVLYAVGKLWSVPAGSDPDAIFRSAMQELFPGIDDETAQALRIYTASFLFYERRTQYRQYAARPRHQEPSLQIQSDKLILSLLEKFQPTENADVIEDICWSLRSRLLQADFSRHIFDYFRKPECRPALHALLEEDRNRLQTIANARLAMFPRFRPGLSDAKYRANYDKYIASMKEVESVADAHGTMTLTLTLPEPYSAPKLKVEIRYRGEDSWETVCDAVHKNPDLHNPNFDVVYPADLHKIPEAMRITEYWFGATGVAFVDLVNQAGRFVPQAITKTTGIVRDAEKILIQDLQFAFLGEQDPVPAVLKDGICNQTHTIELLLAPSALPEDL